MRKRVLQWMVGSVLSAGILLLYLFLFQSGIFTATIIKAMNLLIFSDRGLSMSGEIHGGLARQSFGIQDIKLISSTTGDTLFSAQGVELSGRDINFSQSELIIELMTLDQPALNLQSLEQIQAGPESHSTTFQLIIKDFRIRDATVEYASGIVNNSARIPELVGNLWLLDGHLGLQLRSAQVLLPEFNPDTIGVSGLVGHAPEQGFSLTDIHLITSAGEIGIDGQYLSDATEFDLRVTNFAPLSFMNIAIPPFYRDLRLDLQLGLKYVVDDLSITGSGMVKQNGKAMPIQIQRYKQDATNQRIQLKLGKDSTYLGLVANLDNLGHLEGNFDLFRSDLNPFIPFDALKIERPLGTVRFSGSDKNYKFISALQKMQINGIQFDSLYAQVVVGEDGRIELLPGTVLQGRNRIAFSGAIHNSELDLKSTLELSDYGFIIDPNLSGRMAGTLNLEMLITGASNAPRFKGDFSTQRLGIENMAELTGMGKFDLVLKQAKLLGEFAWQGQDGILFADTLKQFSIATAMSSDEFRLSDFHLQGSEKLISISGSYGTRGIDLEKIRLLSEGHQIKLVDSVLISNVGPAHFIIPHTVLSFNNGGVSFDGEYDGNSGYQVDTKFELLNTTELLEFLNETVDFKGLASGSARIEGKLLDPVIHANFSLLNGSTLSYPSDSAHVDLTLTGQGANAHEIMAFTRGGRLRLKGLLPWGYRVKGAEILAVPQNFTVNVQNYDVNDLNFGSIAGLPLQGRANGSVSIWGTPVHTKMDGLINLNNAHYDTLDFTQAFMEFGYENDVLTFDSLSMVSTWGYGRGSGFIPVSADLMSQARPDLEDAEVGLNFEFNLNEMPFLTNYFTTVDAIQGDFMGNLSFSGPFSAPIRNGKMRGHNGHLELSLLGNPITDIHSEVSLVDNTMTIDHFSGRMLFSEGSALNLQGALGRASSFISDLIGVRVAQSYKGEVAASGQIDFESFFRPRFDLNLKANEVYYRSTDGLIEAIADADLNLVGQDTTDVTAIIPVSRAVYYSNFESSESYQDVISSNVSSLFRYSLDTQFASDLLISNDQMEAEFEGELWLLDYGDEIMRFSGQLTAQEGGKFYYLGNELSILSGEILFNSVDFNPQISMEASIEIDGEPVTLTLTGDLDEPELVINSENSQLTQSDVLAYLTINQKLVEVSFDTKSALNPVKTYSEMLVEKQISKIGREFTGLDILDVGINLDSDTTTVSRFEVGQRLSKNLKVTAGGELQEIGGRTDYDFGLEYRINNNVSVTSKINQNGEVEFNGRLKFTY